MAIASPLALQLPLLTLTSISSLVFLYLFLYHVAFFCDLSSCLRNLKTGICESSMFISPVFAFYLSTFLRLQLLKGSSFVVIAL